MSTSTDVLDEIRTAMKGTPSLDLVHTMSHGIAVQVRQGRKKVGPLLFPPDGGTVADTLQMLGTLATGETSR